METQACPDPTPQRDQFRKTVAENQAKGLQNMKFCRGSNGANSSEEVFDEINRMWAAPDIADDRDI